MTNGIKVQVRYIGQAGRRIVEKYEWNAANGYIQTITSQAMVDRLLANGDFALVQTPDKRAKDRQEDMQ